MACEDGTYYSLELMACYKPDYHSNIDALNQTKRALEIENYTLQVLKDRIAKDNLPFKPCPAEKPMLSNNVCTDCPSPSYFNLKTRSCYKPKSATNIDYLEKSKLAI